jgi:hypothetical protein
MNKIIVNEKTYLLPNDSDMLNMTLNHIGIVQNNKADYVKLFDEQGNAHKLNAFLLNNAKIVTVVNGEEYETIPFKKQVIYFKALANKLRKEFNLDEQDVNTSLNEFITNLH